MIDSQPAESRPSSASQALLALLLIVPAPSLGVLAGMYLWPGTPIGSAAFTAAKVWMFLFPLIWLRFVERAPLSLSPVRRGGLVTGAVLGLLIAGSIWLAWSFIGVHWVDGDHFRTQFGEMGLDRPAKYLAVVAYWILINSLLEEYAYRWFMFRQSERLMGPRLAVLASAVFFTIHHVLALMVYFDWRITTLATLGIFVGGAIWSWLYEHYRSIWPCYVSHAIVDVPIFVIGWTIFF